MAGTNREINASPVLADDTPGAEIMGFVVNGQYVPASQLDAFYSGDKDTVDTVPSASPSSGGTNTEAVVKIVGKATTLYIDAMEALAHSPNPGHTPTNGITARAGTEDRTIPVLTTVSDTHKDDAVRGSDNSTGIANTKRKRPMLAPLLLFGIVAVSGYSVTSGFSPEDNPGSQPVEAIQPTATPDDTATGGNIDDEVLAINPSEPEITDQTQDTLPLVAAQNIPIAMITINGSTNTSWDFDQAEGSQLVFMEDGSTNLSLGFDARLTVDVPENDDPARAGLRIEQDASGVTIVTFDLNNIVVHITPVSDTVIDERTGRDGGFSEPVPLFESLSDGSEGPISETELENWSSAIGASGIDRIILLGSYVEARPSIVDQAIVDAIESISTGPHESTIEELIKQGLVSAYGLDDPIRFQVIFAQSANDNPDNNSPAANYAAITTQQTGFGALVGGSGQYTATFSEIENTASSAPSTN